MRLRYVVFLPGRAGVWLTAIVLSFCGLSLASWMGQTAWFTAHALQPQVFVVNAASFSTDQAIAPDTLATAFGSFVTQNNQNFFAPSGILPLPTTLGGV